MLFLKKKVGMFIVRRKLSGKERWCVLLCQSEREGVKVYQKTIKYFGVAHGLNKHTLAMRPIYHFSSKRITAHILICYLAFAVIRYVHQDVNIFEEPISIDNLREGLASVETSILEDKRGHQFALPAPLNKEASRIYRAAGIVRSTTLRQYILAGL